LVILARLLLKVPRPGDKEVTFTSFELNFYCTCLTTYQFDHSKVERSPIKDRSKVFYRKVVMNKPCFPKAWNCPLTC